jgi:hypothetical protein
MSPSGSIVFQTYLSDDPETFFAQWFMNLTAKEINLIEKLQSEKWRQEWKPKIQK